MHSVEDVDVVNVFHDLRDEMRAIMCCMYRDLFENMFAILCQMYGNDIANQQIRIEYKDGKK